MVAFIKLLQNFKYLQKSLIGLFVIYLSGCSTLDLVLPISDIDSPKHHGRPMGWGVELSGSTARKLVLNEDPSSRPLTNLKTTKHATNPIFLTANTVHFHFLNRFTLSGGLIDSKTPNLKLKIAVLTSVQEDAMPGQLYLSISTDVSYQRAENSGNQNGSGGPTGFPWNGKADLISGEGSISFGIQAIKKLTPFIGASIQQFQTSGQINQTAVASDVGGTFLIPLEIGSIAVYGIGLDYRPNPRFYIVPQFNMYNFKWFENNFTDFGGSLRIIYVPL